MFYERNIRARALHRCETLEVQTNTGNNGAISLLFIFAVCARKDQLERGLRVRFIDTIV